MGQRLRTLGTALSRGARRGWAAIRALGWVDLFAALTAIGQWGLLVGLAGLTASTWWLLRLMTRGAQVEGGLAGGVLLGSALILVGLGPATALIARGLWYRLSAAPASFHRRGRSVRRRAGALVIAALAAPVALAVAGAPRARALGGETLRFGFGTLGALCVVIALAGWAVGLSRPTRRWVFGLGVAGMLTSVLMGRLPLLPTLPSPSSLTRAEWAIRKNMEFGLVLFGLFVSGYLLAGLWLRAQFRQPFASPNASPLPSPLPSLPLLPPSPPPPPTLALPRSPVTGMVRRRLEL